MPRRGLSILLCTMLAVGAASLAARAPQAGAATPCDRFASPDGSDSAAGTLQAPYATPKKLVSSLSAGQVGCFRAGTYSFTSFSIKTARITLRPYGSEKATLRGRSGSTRPARGR